ncbi:hypothetical protein SAMN02743940_1501 [Nitrosomonas cryotolerans ATCC 49181]|uniref:Uncharacterized protein n=1 Tax=Nitrosomonas cryotolerans ATCC 49181 TaxID=1131553 RepID=A0A1N6I2R6_9PROT|nr:hypothetical protein SAMN02743940_1501 [Nitrosomonas cryotolerans ATCC 49181]
MLGNAVMRFLLRKQYILDFYKNPPQRFFTVDYKRLIFQLLEFRKDLTWFIQRQGMKRFFGISCGEAVPLPPSFYETSGSMEMSILQ